MTTRFKAIKKIPEFEKDLKYLLKRFPTLDDDLSIFIDTQLYLYHKLNQDNGGIFQLSDLGLTYPKIYKAKKFACKSLKGKGCNSGIRVIYAYFEEEDVIELIQIYYKGDKENFVIKLYILAK